MHMTCGSKLSVRASSFPGRDYIIHGTPNRYRVQNRPGSISWECQLLGFKVRGLIYLSSINLRFVLDFFHKIR
jgi:hypothetical protein